MGNYILRDMVRFTDEYVDWITNFKYGNYVVLDIETDGTDPFSKTSKIVYIGFRDKNRVVLLKDNDLTFEKVWDTVMSFAKGEHPTLIVGHNLKFDLLFLRTKMSVNLMGYHLWDTSVAEYMLSGQAHKWPALDDVAKERLGVGKDETVKELLKAGKLVSELDEEMVLDYLSRDLEITEGVFLSQIAETEDHVLPAILVQMEALTAYADLEYYGMPFDRHGLVRAHFTCEQQLELNEKKLVSLLGSWGAPVDTNLTSNHTISTLLWGSPGVKFRSQMLVGQYKNGKDKYKFVEGRWVPDFHLNPADFSVEKKAHGCYDVSDKALDAAVAALRTAPESAPDHDLADYIETLRDSRKISKVDGTYFVPLIEMIDKAEDGRVHAEINQTATHTGRTSSRNPNQQNMPPVVRKFLDTKGVGVLLESDFAQLEVCALALLTGDLQLCEDINNGEDIHYLTGKEVMGWTSPSDMTKADRRTVKGVNFGIIYGGGPVTISNQTGAPEGLVRSLIAAFYKRYPGVKRWQKTVISEVQALGAITSESPVLMGQYAKVAKWPSITGRTYTFTEEVVPENYRRGGSPLSFKPTEIKNYPVQGFATGDLVPIVAGLIGRHYNGDAQLLAVVHDSFLFDTSGGEETEDVRNFLDLAVSYGLPKILERVWGITSPVVFRMDHEEKTHW